MESKENSKQIMGREYEKEIEYETAKAATDICDIIRDMPLCQASAALEIAKAFLGAVNR